MRTFSKFWGSLTQHLSRGQQLRYRLGGAIISVLILLQFYTPIQQFKLPLSHFQNQSDGYLILIAVAIVWLLLCLFGYCYKRLKLKWLNMGVALVLLPICFIATSPISGIDYAYIFFPTAKMLQGDSIFNIYFQYDLLLSILATIWLKLGFNLGDFQILGQGAYFTCFLAIFVISQQIFKQKITAFLLIFTLVLVRIYAIPWDSVYHFQSTPLRLDLWVALFIIIWRKGPFHWLAATLCGALLLLHRNFGLIHTLAYVQLLLTLSAISIIDNQDHQTVKQSIKISVKQIIPAIIIITVSYLSTQFLFRGEQANATSYYQKIGIGFLPMPETSFFWYYLPIIPVAFILLYELRKYVSYQYLSLGFFLLFCTIGNLIYYFGRSHDGNLFSISISLIFLLFYVFDLINRLIIGLNLTSRLGHIFEKFAVLSVMIGVILILTASYARNITEKVNMQLYTAFALQIHQPDPFLTSKPSVDEILTEVKKITNDSRNVQFYVENSETEFLLFHYGNYKPVGYFHPLTAWIFVDELTQQIQKLVNAEYYIVIQKDLYDDIFMQRLTNTNWIYHIKDNYVIVSSIAPTKAP